MFCVEINLFNSHLNDLLYIVELADVCHFGDDTMIHFYDDRLPSFISRLENGFFSGMML